MGFQLEKESFGRKEGATKLGGSWKGRLLRVLPSLSPNGK